jgi:hypothetical protein
LFNRLKRFTDGNRLLPIQLGILATFFLIPFWMRFPNSPTSFAALYSTGFMIFWFVLWTVGWWLATGLPGFRELRQDRLRSWWALLLVAMACWALLSWSWAYVRVIRPEVTIGAAMPFALAVLFGVAVACAAPSLRTILIVLAIGLLLNSVVAGWQVAKQGPITNGFLNEFNIDPARSGVSVVVADGIRWLRPYGFLPHPNILAGFLTVGLLATTALILGERGRLRWIGIGIFLVGLWALMLTFSRAAWLGFAAGGFAMLPILWPQLRQRANRKAVVTLAVLAIGAAGLFAAIYRPYLSARTGLDNEAVEQRSVVDRVIFTEMAFRAINESPILGVGIGNFPWKATHYLLETDFDTRGIPVHQVFLSAWSELGLVGLGLTTLMLIAGIEVVLRKMRVRGDPTDRPDEHSDYLARAAMLGGVIALMVIGLFDHYPWTLLHFQALWFGLLAAAGSVSRSPLPSHTG